MPIMIKRFIAPFQKVLLTKRLCPGCTMPLDKADHYPFEGNEEMVVCKCKRMFIFDKMTNTYRRATIREADLFSKKG